MGQLNGPLHREAFPGPLSTVVTFPSLTVTLEHIALLSLLPSIHLSLKLSCLMTFFLAYCQSLSTRIKDLCEQDLAPSTEYVLNKYLTMKGPLLSLLGPEDYFFPGFSQLALQGGELEWKQPDLPEADVPKLCMHRPG